MKFFEAQRVARRNTVFLAALFCLNVVLISGLNAWVLYYFAKNSKEGHLIGPDYMHKVFFWSIAALVTVTLFYLGNIPKAEKLASLMGGRELITPENEEERRLQNVVEEMAIASGVPLPKIFIMSYDPGINAFAAGVEPSSIVIGVTSGTVQLLSRDELQGVIGHEFSHVLNEDMKLNMRLAAVVMAFQFFVRMGDNFIRRQSRSTRRKKNDSSFLLGAIMIILGSLGYFLGRVIQSLISQQREYLADASSAQFTRNPESLARALGKIKLGAGSRMGSLVRHEYAHIFFAEAVSTRFSNWLSTHPELSERIQKLVPHRKFEDFLGDLHVDMTADLKMQEHAAYRAQNIMSTPSVMESIGAPTDRALALSHEMIDQIRPVRVYLRNPEIARGTLALLTFKSQAQYAEAKELLRFEFNVPMAFEQIESLVESDNVQLRITLFHYVLETLRSLSLKEKELLLAQMKKVYLADEKLNLLEALMYINARILLLPGAAPKSQGGVTLAEILKDPHHVDLLKLENFVAAEQRQPLLKKRKTVEEALAGFTGGAVSYKEEFRLLCLAIRVPVPPF